ncbi:hypothetical protein JSY36_04145 [Bacillus sp. H-16]|uniref:DUF5658 family protein n=1 Tax=Alteribacter salitolerans TaxID=2912333 RepID=UPI001966C0AF|nr:DUF5658 family protein [Alteribacter salitolerans]MBM7094941.1 hypothetical protein [Alteribacter salitolerans]
MKKLLLSTALLNMTDALLTVAGIRMGEIEEANPVMAWAYAIDPLFFLTVKFVLTAATIILIPVLHYPLRRSIAGMVIVAFTGYVFVHGIHLAWIGLWFGVW